MSPGLHRVRRQSWHLRVASAQAAFAARTRFRAEVEDLLPAFARAFDAWAPRDEVVRIPRLELKLRLASLDELETALGEALRRATPPREAVPARPAAPDRLAILLRYLETGALEWHAAQGDGAIAAAELRATALAELRAAVAGPPAGATPLHALHYFLRLVQLVPAERWPELAGAAASRAHPIPAASGEQPGPAATPPGKEAAAAPDPAAALNSVAAARARIGERAAALLAAAVLAVVRGRLPPARHALDDIAAETGIAALPELPAATAALFPVRPVPPSSRIARLPQADAHRARPGIVAPQRREGAAPAFALMTAHAGLVLLHPFLPALLEACGVYTPDRGLAVPALPRAAALLHWLATGRDEPWEFDLAAVKVLLGLRPDDPLPTGAGLLGESERDEGDALLRAAIGHWKALKGTSIDGLRVSFLQRRGALSEDDAGFRLRLEAESFDVLIKHLPWSIDTVKLPWMTRPLCTDWPTA